MAVKLTPLAKGLITVVVVGAVGVGIYMNRHRLAPGKKDETHSNIPPPAPLPGEGTGTAAQVTPPMPVPDKPGCADKPEVRFYHWAWNAQMGLMYATGGKQAAEGSLM